MNDGQKRTRGAGRIWKRGEYYWIQFYNADGRQVRLSSKSPDRKVAEKMLRKKLGEVAAGIVVDHRGLRYEDIRASYLRERMARSKSILRCGVDGLPIFNAVTRADGFFKGKHARKITTDTLNEFIASQQRQGYKPASINRSLSAVQRMFRLAQRGGKIHQVPHFSKLPERNTRTGYFDVDDYRRLLAVLPNHLKAVLAIGFWCGLRIGEICSLRWEQVDFLDRVIRLNPFETKNNEPRTVPLSAELFGMLQAHRAACPREFEYVAYRPGPERLGAIPAKMWKKCCKQVGLQGRLFHDLRRSAVRNLTRAGVPEKVSMKISGHKTRSVFERYNIVNERDLLEAGRKLENYITEVGDKTGTIEAPAEVHTEVKKPQVQ